MKNKKVLMLVESALLIAVGTILSMLKIDMPLGGGLTIVSMLPLVLISFRYGWKWGLLCGFEYSLLQLILGVDNVQYGTSPLMVIAIILFDYVVAYTVIGLAGIFRGKFNNGILEIVLGIVVTFLLRFACHFITGVWIWDALWPNEFGMTSVVYSLAYNGWYMGAETVITCIVASIIYKPLKRYFEPAK